MTPPLLYTYRRCPYAMRARMALIVASVAFDACEIQLRDKPAGMLAISPKGTVPVLQLPDGTVLEESLDIMRWAFEGRDPQAWWERGLIERNASLVATNDGEFKQHLDRYKYPGRFDGADASSHREEAVSCLLQPLEQRLAAEPWLGGQAPCAADLALFPFVRQFRAVDQAWFDARPLPATQRWLQSWLEDARFETCMRKLPVGTRTGF